MTFIITILSILKDAYIKYNYQKNEKVPEKSNDVAE